MMIRNKKPKPKVSFFLSVIFASREESGIRILTTL
jgi:trehalose-6-phosphate synthase